MKSEMEIEMETEMESETDTKLEWVKKTRKIQEKKNIRKKHE